MRIAIFGFQPSAATIKALTKRFGVPGDTEILEAQNVVLSEPSPAGNGAYNLKCAVEIGAYAGMRHSARATVTLQDPILEAYAADMANVPPVGASRPGWYPLTPVKGAFLLEDSTEVEITDRNTGEIRTVMSTPLVASIINGLESGSAARKATVITDFDL